MRQALSLLVFCVLASSTFASTTLPTALKPVTIIRQNDIVHVFTSPVDVDYDGEKDPVDRPATWQIIDVATLTTVRTLEFPWVLVNAQRPWLSQSTDKMFVAVGDSIIAYSATTQAYIGSIFLGPSSGLYLDEAANELYSSHRIGFTDPGVVHVYSFVNSTANDIPVGVNPQQIAGFLSSTNGPGTLILSEGQFAQGDGTVMLVSNNGPATTIPVGDTPNHVVISGDSAYITVNGSHFVVVIDLNTRAAVDTILVGTSGFDGPRESVVHDGRLFVTTYAGDIRILDIATGARVGTIQHGTKPEGLVVVGNTLWVTRAMDANYAADSGIVAYDLNGATGLSWNVFAPDTDNNLLPVYPSIASETVTISTPSGIESLVFLTSDGKAVQPAKLSSDGTNVTYSVTSLPSGGYTCFQGAKRGRFIVIR